MGLITKYGSFWGLVPQTTGRTFWVAPSASYVVEGNTYPASDNNDGLSPERALLTANQAITNATANVGDVIVLLPGAHSVSSTIAVTKAGLTIVGIPGGMMRTTTLRHNSGGRRTRTTLTCTATAGICITVSAVDTEIAYITFLPAAAGGRGISLAPLSGAANRTYIHDCAFAMVATASVTTYGVTVPAGVTADLLEDTLVSHCYFVSGLDTSTGANGSAVNTLGTTSSFTIEQCTFELKGTAAWANAILASNAGGKGLVIRDCDFINPTSATTVITTAINTTGQTIDGSTQVHRCYIPTGTDGVTASAMVDIVLTETYLANSSGGALVTNA
jgi:hypothetical protein